MDFDFLGAKILHFRNPKNWLIFCENAPTLTGARFASFGVMALIQSAKWSWNTIFFDFQKFGTRRNFYRQQILVWKSGKNASKMAKIADFEGNPVEISEVLPVEISTIRSGLSSSFTGKKNHVIWTHRWCFNAKTFSPPHVRPVLDRASLISNLEISTYNIIQ